MKQTSLEDSNCINSISINQRRSKSRCWRFISWSSQIIIKSWTCSRRRMATILFKRPRKLPMRSKSLNITPLSCKRELRRQGPQAKLRMKFLKWKRMLRFVPRLEWREKRARLRTLRIWLHSWTLNLSVNLTPKGLKGWPNPKINGRSVNNSSNCTRIFPMTEYWSEWLKKNSLPTKRSGTQLNTTLLERKLTKSWRFSQHKIKVSSPRQVSSVLPNLRNSNRPTRAFKQWKSVSKPWHRRKKQPLKSQSWRKPRPTFWRPNPDSDNRCSTFRKMSLKGLSVKSARKLQELSHSHQWHSR